MRKLLSLALACNLTVVGATSVIACGAGDGPVVGMSVYDKGQAGSNVINDAYSSKFSGHDNRDAGFNYVYKFMPDQIGQIALTAINLRSQNINTDFREKQIAFDKNQFLPMGIEGEHNSNDKAFHSAIWNNFYKDWSNADDSYFTNFSLNAPKTPGDKNWDPANNVALDSVPFADNLTKNDYFASPKSGYQADDYHQPSDYNINNVQQDNLVTFSPVKSVLDYLNKVQTPGDKDAQKKYYLSWLNKPQPTDDKTAPGVTQQARHVLVPIGGANGIAAQVTFEDNDQKFHFNVQIHNLVARIDLGVYKHTVNIGKDNSVDYWYQAWYFSGYDFWNPDKLNNLTTDSATKPYFEKTQTSDDGIPFYVGAATDISNPTADVAVSDKTDNSVFINKSIIVNGYSYYEFKCNILPESLKMS